MFERKKICLVRYIENEMKWMRDIRKEKKKISNYILFVLGLKEEKRITAVITGTVLETLVINEFSFT